MLFCALVMAGQVVFAFASNLNNYPLALVGRFIFGYLFGRSWLTPLSPDH